MENNKKENQHQTPNKWSILLKIAPFCCIAGGLLYILISWPYISTWAYYTLPGGEMMSQALTGGVILCVMAIVAFIFFKIGSILAKHGDIFRGIRKTGLKRVLKVFTALFAIALVIAGIGTFFLSIFSWTYRFYTAGPYLTWNNGQDPSNAVTVCWHTATATKSQVTYGLTENNLDQESTAEGWSTFHFVKLGGLQPNSTYYYAVSGQDFGVKHFHTAPSPGKNGTFTFVVWSDPRTNNGLGTALQMPNLPSYMATDLMGSGTSLAFSIVTGDVSCTGPSYDTWNLYLNDITTDDFASNAPNMDAIGNHEHHGDPELLNFHKYYPYEQCNYSFVFGQIYFLMLDTFNYTSGEWENVNFPQAQFEWAKADLAAHADVPFKIICMHQSPINYGEFQYGGHHGNIANELLYLCGTYGVDALFCGHSHHYEVSYLNGTHYIMQGIGGNENREDWVYGGWDCGVTEAGGEIIASGGKDTGWMRVDVTPAQIHIRPIMIDGNEYPGFWLNATDNPD